MNKPSDKADIRVLSKDQLFAAVEKMGEARFRAKQVYEWLWKKSARNFDEMTNLSKNLREALKDNYVINAITEDMSQNSIDGTIKTPF